MPFEATKSRKASPVAPDASTATSIARSANNAFASSSVYPMEVFFAPAAIIAAFSSSRSALEGSSCRGLGFRMAGASPNRDGPGSVGAAEGASIDGDGAGAAEGTGLVVDGASGSGKGAGDASVSSVSNADGSSAG